MIIVIFGLPGTGKTYVGNLLRDEFGFFFYEGDKDLTRDIKKAILEKRIFTDPMRNDFFKKLIGSVLKISENHKNLVVAQTFIKEKYREQFLEKFPDAIFVLVKTNKKLREERLSKRKSVNDLDYIREMVKIFEEPKIKHVVLENDTKGKEELKQKINQILGDLGF